MSAPSSGSDSDAYVRLENVSKHFGDFVAVNHVSLSIASGEIFCLLGASGCGKTTLLRIIAGLESPEAGQVLFDGRDATHWPIRDRKVGFVFQNYALFKHMSVFDNMAYGLRIRGLVKPDIARRVQAAAEASWFISTYR